MRDVDERGADLAHFPLDADELDLHLLAELEVERTQRLVEQQDARAVDERTRERDPLALSAGELDGLAISDAGQPDDFENLLHPLPPHSARDAFYAQAVGDVLRHGHMRKECVILEDRVHVALVRRRARDFPAVELDAAGIRSLEAGDQPQRRRLAGARRAEEGEELSRLDLEIDAVDGDDVPVGLANADEAYVRCRSRSVGHPRRLRERLRRQASPPVDRARARGRRPRSKAARVCERRCRRYRRRGVRGRGRGPTQ